jgi:DUF438 domain-containing protein
MMELGPDTRIEELLKEYPFLLDFLIGRSPKFKMLRSAAMRRTVGRVAPISHVASIAGIDASQLLADISEEIKRKTGTEVRLKAGFVPPPSRPAGASARQEVLKGIIRDLHAGVDMSVLKQRFHELIKDIEPSEIARLEQKLIEEGMPESEIKRLCDVHVEVFKEALSGKEPPAVPPGHPVDTFMKENRAAETIIEEIIGILERLCDTSEKEVFGQCREDLMGLVTSLSDINLHFLRKENQLFPILEEREISGPSEVMWALHDDIRQMIRYAREQIEGLQVPVVYATLKYLLRSISDMIYKEEHILFPMALEELTDDDWAQVAKGEDEIGYAWISPAKGWAPRKQPAGQPAGEPETEAAMNLETGHLTPEQANLVFKSLPVDLTFVDEKDEVAYYSQTRERIFPRSPGVIGRKVQKCHPPKSYHIVQKIVDEFRAGTRDAADFWIQMKGRFILIRYYAVRDERGIYKGTLEVSQDVTEIRRLEGEKRLLD